MSAGIPEIVSFRDELAGEFERLNREWLEGYALLEDGDLPYISDPRTNIIDRGGTILFAIDHDAVLGTVAVIPQSEGVFELAKLAVAREARGRGIGRTLTSAAIDFAINAGADLLVLSSNSRLTAAIGLYESLGFRHAAATSGVAYETADVFMQLRIGPTHDIEPATK
jgi:ribosomal protein S18 acetylase RimI-like enzyme